MKASKSAAQSKPRSRRPPAAPPGRLVEPPEQGLSVDPEELGTSFLRHATEQGNFETARAEPVQFGLLVEPSSDDAPRESPGTGSLWERTVDNALSTEEEDADALETVDDRDSPAVARGVAQVDLNASVIEEASLLDAEGDVLGEVVPAEPDTDDVGRHARRAAAGVPTKR